MDLVNITIVVSIQWRMIYWMSFIGRSDLLYLTIFKNSLNSLQVFHLLEYFNIP